MKRLLLLLQLIAGICSVHAIENVDLFVIGTNVNGHSWVMEDSEAKMTNISPGIYEWNGRELGTTFKINNGQWEDATTNIGSNGDKIVIGETYYYQTGYYSRNFIFTEGLTLLNPHIILNTIEGTIVVEGTMSDEKSADYYIVGTFNDWAINKPEAEMHKEGKYYVKRGLVVTEPNEIGFFKIAAPNWIDSWGYGTYSERNYVSEQSPSLTLTCESKYQNSDVKYELSGVYTVRWYPDKEVVKFYRDGEDPDDYDFGDLYLIGEDVNGAHWQQADPNSKFYYIGEGIYQWSGNYLGNGFKINDGTWNSRIVNGVCLNIGAGDDYLSLDVPYPFVASSNSRDIGFYDVEEVSNPLVTLDMVEKTVTVTIDGHLLTINLPEGAEDGRYKNCILELEDAANGVKHRYVVTDRLNYTFQNIKSGNSYTARLYSPNNIELGIIPNITVADKDVSCEFLTIKNLYPVCAQILSPEGNDITSEVSIEWFRVNQNNERQFLYRGVSPGSYTEGEGLICVVALGDKYATSYHTPEEISYTVKKGDNTKNICSIVLAPFRSIELRGTVTDADASPLNEASVALSQTLNGKYSKTFTAKTDSKGAWSATVLDAPQTRITYAAADCVNVNDTIGAFNTDKTTIDLGTIVMKPIAGARISYAFTFFAAGAETTDSHYKDYQNVTINVFNTTQNREHTNLSVQYPLIAILDDGINAGDELHLTASSKTGAFNPVTTIVTLGEDQRASASFALIGKGGVEASFEMTENPAVIAMLYSAKGELLKKQVYSEAKTTFADLNDGDYTIVTMGQSDLMNAILRLDSFAELGLVEGKDYIKSAVKVASGVLSEVRIPEVPAFDESLFYYTNSSTGFSANKTSFTTGNYLTLHSIIDFKSVYKTGVSNVALIVDLPEACDFVEKSVIQGHDLLPYTINNNRLTIPLGTNYQSKIRFCVIPTSGGSFNASASITFDYNGRSIAQPIGAALAEIKDIEIKAPKTITKKSFSISGNAAANSEVLVYWDNNLVASTRVNKSGDWKCDLEFEELMQFKKYELYVKIIKNDGHILSTETKTIVFDMETPMVNKVTMVNTAHPSESLRLCQYTTVFDFQNAASHTAPYWYWPEYPTFTFFAEVPDSENNTITSVTIYALTEKGAWIPMKAQKDKTTGNWVVAKDFFSGNLPVNVGVSYSYTSDGVSLEKLAQSISDSFTDYSILADNNAADIEYVESGNELIFQYKNPVSGDFKAKSISVTGDTTELTYESEGSNKKLTIELAGYNDLPATMNVYPLNDKDRFHIFTDAQKVQIFYPTDFLRKLTNLISFSGKSKNEYFNKLLEAAAGKKYAAVIVCIDGNGSNVVRKKDILDEALNNCPDLEPIIDRMRRRAEHSNRSNQDLDRMKAPLEWGARALDLIEHPVAEAAGRALETGNMALEFGQSAGNYINNLADRNDLAALKSAECIPPNDSPTPNESSPSGNQGYVMDPSGFVYEAVPENRVEGVQASIYYKEVKEDMYGDPYEEVALWNAEEYAQKNPLFTDENGMYQWDVPQGLWQVKFEKDGYETAFSEWLPVPPPQLDVNIGMMQRKQPEVIEARAYEQGIEVQFDKYMSLTTLTTANIYVTANGEKLAGKIHAIDDALADEYADEDDDSALRYASRVRFVPETPLSVTTDEIRLTVSRNVRSYAGIPMTETFSQVLDVEKEVQMIYANDVKVLYGDVKEVTVYAMPYEAAVGRTLRIANSSALIATVDISEVTLDDEGKAVVTVSGDLPGRTQLSFAIDGVTATGECAVEVVTELITAEAPAASRASGTAVYRGTKVELTTDTKNATIYFTTDGSCPCDENGTRRKYTVPIVINDDMKILAITVVGSSDGNVSDIVEFNYTLKRSDMEFRLDKGWTWISHSFESALTPGDIAAHESITRVVSHLQEASRYDISGLSGTLEALHASQSYKVYSTAAVPAIRIAGIAHNPATPIAISEGWNWLGYPLTQTMTVAEALANTKPDALDVVVGQNGFAQFDGVEWVGTLALMVPGAGYMYYSQKAKELVYTTSIVSDAARKRPRGGSIAPYLLDIHKYATIMPLTAILEGDSGTQLESSDFRVAAFCDSECRGIGQVVHGFVMMNVYGNPGDIITIQVTDAAGGIKYDTKASIIFDEVVTGDLHHPYIISVNDRSGVAAQGCEGAVALTLDGDMLRIKGIAAEDINLVEIYDVDGLKRLRQTAVSPSGIHVSSLAPGVYIVVVEGKAADATALSVRNLFVIPHF